MLLVECESEAPEGDELTNHAWQAACREFARECSALLKEVYGLDLDAEPVYVDHVDIAAIRRARPTTLRWEELVDAGIMDKRQVGDIIDQAGRRPGF